MYGANTSGVNAGYYQDSTFPEAMHGYLLQGGKYGVVNYPSAAIHGCSTSTNWSGRRQL